MHARHGRLRFDLFSRLLGGSLALARPKCPRGYRSLSARFAPRSGFPFERFEKPSTSVGPAPGCSARAESIESKDSLRKQFFLLKGKRRDGKGTFWQEFRKMIFAVCAEAGDLVSIAGGGSFCVAAISGVAARSITRKSPSFKIDPSTPVVAFASVAKARRLQLRDEARRYQLCRCRARACAPCGHSNYEAPGRPLNRGKKARQKEVPRLCQILPPSLCAGVARRSTRPAPIWRGVIWAEGCRRVSSLGFSRVGLSRRIPQLEGLQGERNDRGQRDRRRGRGRSRSLL